MKTMKKTWLSLSVAGTVMIAGYALPPVPVLAAEGAAVPVSAKTDGAVQAEFITSTELGSKSEWLKTNVKVPVLQGLQDKKYQEELNYIIQSHAEKDIANWEKEAEEAAADMKKNGYEMRPYELIVDYELKSDGSGKPEGIVSLRVVTYAQTGGTGMPRVDTYTIRDEAEATRVTLAELFGDKYKETIDAFIKAEIAKDPDSYFPEEFKGISTEQAFYVENGEAVIVFPKYAIAPGAAGNPEFRLPIPGLETDKGSESEQAKESFTLYRNQVFADASGNTMIPLRLVAERIGFEITWVPDTMTAELKKGANWTTVTIGKDAYFFARMAPMPLGAAPVLVESSTYVPLKFMTDILKADVKEENGSIVISWS
ncbi:stalk domain-containing protein [Paenibacillus sp. GYB004]|uniref:stalk domain-containing protein n=1 Tax=Paenibacillus sp. GYB004 TaxID=2994393 RepID=UPI002F965682